jgi:uncharacterized membrane protein SirB2
MLKILHMTIAMISVLFFTFRFALTLADSNKLTLKWLKWLKIAPHIIDTFYWVLGLRYRFS